MNRINRIESEQAHLAETYKIPYEIHKYLILWYKYFQKIVWCSDLLWQPFITLRMVAIGVSHGGWLDPKDECDCGGSDDFQFGCSQESMVQWLSLPSDNLSGLLMQLNGLILNNNGLTGLIPSELGLLTQLTNWRAAFHTPFVPVLLLLLIAESLRLWLPTKSRSLADAII